MFFSRCFNPWWHPRLGVPFPCNKCLYCLYQRRLKWTNRLDLEALQYGDKIAFVTLTYDAISCPRDYSLVPTEISAYIKRLRHYLKGVKIKYYGCGEYGETRGRPHYHLLIFGVDIYRDARAMVSAWQSRGIVKILPALDGSSRYVAGYVTKKLGIDSYGDRYPPYQRFSKGLGYHIIEKLQFFTDQLKIGDRLIKFDRYLKNKCYEKFFNSTQIQEIKQNLMRDWHNSIVELCKFYQIEPYLFNLRPLHLKLIQPFRENFTARHNLFNKRLLE